MKIFFYSSAAACAIMLVLLTGCGSASNAYLARIQAQPTDFAVPAALADSTWLRAHSFITDYAKAKILVMTDHLMVTSEPSESVPYNYRVVRLAPFRDSVRFSVIPAFYGGGNRNIEGAQQRAAAIALFMRTGELPPAGLFDF